MKETIQNHSTNNKKNTVNTSSKTPTQLSKHPPPTHTLQNNFKQPQYKTHTKWNSYNTLKFPQYKVTLMHMVLFSPILHRNYTSLHFTSLQNQITSHKSRQFTPHHYTSHHFTYLHSTPTSIPLLVTTFITHFLNVFSLQGKDAQLLFIIL